MREDLIAYALDELDDVDRQKVEELLASDPDLRAELDQIQCCLQGFEEDDCECEDMPSDLADRTTAGILSGSIVCPSETDGLKPDLNYGSVHAFMSPMDMTVAIGILITIGSLLIPAIYNNRNANQKLTCTNNLRQLGNYMSQYAEYNSGHYYPVVRPYEHAGIFASRLLDSDITAPGELDRLLVCPSSPLAERLMERSQTFHVPSLADLSMAKGPWLVEIKRYSSGSYGYQPGHVNGRFYLPARDTSNCRVPVLSDTPSRVDNFRTSDNHGGQFVNVLFQDGSVRSLTQPMIAPNCDHLFLNAEGVPSVSHEWNDAVLLTSEATPGEQFPVQPMPQAVYRFFLKIETRQP
ncbi:anti-sigma factor family protein [Aeoliella mucimassa]|uniref:Type II secretion system protein G n=1 Tax=Aeoliella mucimassa TaxID=2527972 RepID=A0A518AWN1_9BACT|nr:hypothetical protein [Aeoliella mucimassa]QDU59101.1 hypothetical protein Pan181_53420 [Aeoliella mucimassa]